MGWQPMTPDVAVRNPERTLALRNRLIEMGKSDDEIAAVLEDPKELWANDRYTAIVNRADGPEGDNRVTWLSIHANDRSAIHDWRDLQRIKNDIAGPETEAIELYPAESRLVDTANQYHLWVMPPGARFPIGFVERFVLDETVAENFGSVQRPFDEPTIMTPMNDIGGEGTLVTFGDDL